MGRGALKPSPRPDVSIVNFDVFSRILYPGVSHMYPVFRTYSHVFSCIHYYFYRRHPRTPCHCRLHSEPHGINILPCLLNLPGRRHASVMQIATCCWKCSPMAYRAFRCGGALATFLNRSGIPNTLRMLRASCCVRCAAVREREQRAERAGRASWHDAPDVRRRLNIL